MRHDHEDGVGDLCLVQGCFDLPHQGQLAFKIKVLRGKTTRRERSEDETGDEGGEEPGGRDVKVTVISFGISSNDICTHGVS